MDKSPTKPRKAPARKPGVLPYATKIQILNWLLRGHPSAATDPKTLKNELRILGILLKSYPVPAFWLSLRIALDLQSMCFFLSQTGGQELEKKWRLYLFEKNQGKPQKGLDSISNCPMLAEDLCFVEGEEPAQNTPPPPPEPPRRKTSALDWADSSTE